jgi:uncharacterized protein (TIGR00269 family)
MRMLKATRFFSMGGHCAEAMGPKSDCTKTCDRCGQEAVAFIRYSGAHLCRNHFFEFVEKRVRKDLKRQMAAWKGKKRLRVGVALSGGKDSSATLAILQRLLSKRTGTDIVAILVDEGIEGYRPRTREAALDLCQQLGVPLVIGSLENEFGLTMDDIATVAREQTPCTYCGVLRRYILNMIARELGCDVLATGLNLDDTAQSILMNVARGDVERLARLGPHARVQKGLVPRVQPLRSIPEKESFLYAYLKGIRFSHAECPYADAAVRNKYRKIIFELEDDSPGTRHALLQSYEALRECLAERFEPAKLRPCKACGEPTVKEVCEACTLVADVRTRSAPGRKT